MSEKAMRRNEEREAEMHCASQYKYYHITDAHRAGHTHTLTHARAYRLHSAVMTHFRQITFSAFCVTDLNIR